MTRLLDLGVPYYLIQNVLIGVMAQRLVHALPVLQDEWPDRGRAVGGIGPALAAAKPDTVGVPGCSECRKTGYLGPGGFVRTADGDAGTAPLVAG